MAEVKIENLNKTYAGGKRREVIAVENSNLTIKDGEFMVFVGPSGCGKSTTLRMIAGLEEISKGSIFIDGVRVNDVPSKNRDIAMVFQNYALYPHMTVYKNMAFGLELRKYPKEEINKRVRDAAEILGLTDEMLERKPKALSGGQRQRVAVGRAIVRKPKVFLFDEPLSNLDAKMRVQMRTEISKLHQRLSTTMIYVTHDQVEAMTMGDRICVMSGGRIQQVAEPLEIYNYPVNVYVAGFIGSPPMNFFEGSMVQTSEGVYFKEAGSGSVHVKATEEQAKRLAPSVGKSVILGIRPENLQEKAQVSGADPTSIFTAMVEVIEPMGAETFIYLNTGASSIILRSQSHEHHEENKQIELVANLNKATFFTFPEKENYKKANGDFDFERWAAAAGKIV